MFRWFSLAALVGCLTISTFYRRRARLESGTIPRRREKPALLAGRAVIALPLFLGILAYISNPRWMAWAEFAVPHWARWIGVFVGVLTVPAAYWVFTSLGRNVSETVLTKDRHQLVIPLEERELVAKFGDEYRAYMQRTGRLLPRAFNSSAMDRAV